MHNLHRDSSIATIPLKSRKGSWDDKVCGLPDRNIEQILQKSKAQISWVWSQIDLSFISVLCHSDVFGGLNEYS